LLIAVAGAEQRGGYTVQRNLARLNGGHAAATQAAGGGYPSYEVVFEWGYRVQFTKFLYIQPDMQYVVNPGGTHTIPNALVLGAQCSVTF